LRKKQILALLVIITFLNVAGISLALVGNGEDKIATDVFLKENLQNSSKIKDYMPNDATSRFAGRTLEGSGSVVESATVSGVELATDEPWVVQLIDDFTGEIYDQEFECVLEGDKCNIWIGLSPDIWDGGFQDEYDPQGEGFEDDVWYFAYPWSSIGIDAVEAEAPDPDEDGYYLPPEYRDWITGEDLNHIRDEFDDNIHDNVVDHFGEYADRPGPFDDYKIQVLIFNMRDGLFYDPITAPWFIIGYFWSVASEANDANIFHMDTYQWWRRLGTPSDIYFGLGPLPLQYEGTFAHEFQHLVHNDVDPNELSWVNEGCSTLAEWICGYGFPSGHISEYLLYWWDTSLVIWQGTLADYGVVFLWTFYMWEHYGGDPLIWDLVHEPLDGIEGWNAVLTTHSIGKSFDEIFQDWAIANYLDGEGIYGYDALDIPSEDTEGWDIAQTLYLWEHNNPTMFDTEVHSYPNEGFNYPYGSSLPYVANYINFYKDGGAHILSVDFDGDDLCGIPAHGGDYKWHSGGSEYAWFRLGQTFNIPLGGATLNFYNNFEIELEWDFGYVEVHDVTADEWYTLQGSLTVDDVGFNLGTDNPNCPEGLEPTDYYDAGRWHAFTGSSGGWYLESMDLTPFAGHEIELFFTYWTDPYTLEAGWYIDDISIPEIGFTDDVETGENGWTSYTGWYRSNILHNNDFTVNFMAFTYEYGKNGELMNSYYELSSMALDPDTETGYEEFLLIDLNGIEKHAVMVITNQPGFEHTFGSAYSFTADVTRVEDFWWEWQWRLNEKVM
jgi:hypothetical protein